MSRLTGLDGAFLALESPTTHLHIMGAMVFDPTGVPDGLGFRRIRALVDERVPLVPPFRMRMAEVPFGLQHPTMVDDPDFDLDYHVRRASLPAPGSTVELTELVADLASRPLDRTRPLWEFHVVEGLAEGRIGIVSKVHHAIIDGVSGAEVLAAFFDLSPDPTPRALFGADKGGRRPQLGVPRPRAARYLHCQCRRFAVASRYAKASALAFWASKEAGFSPWGTFLSTDKISKKMI